MQDDTERDNPYTSLEHRREEERRAVEEAGGGESEGFELAEQELIEHASHGDYHSTEPVFRDAKGDNAPDGDDTYGEPDREHKQD